MSSTAIHALSDVMSLEAMDVPAHIAVIMDGNGRWAAARRMPRIFGHQAGAQAVRRVVEACCELGVRTLTLYAFSWENWDRPVEEINELMRLLEDFLLGEEPTLRAQHIRLRAIGRLATLPSSTRSTLERLVQSTASYERMTLTLALSYGGRQEILDAVRRVAELVQQGLCQPDQITEQFFTQQLYAPDVPDPDLLIRTSGEQRLSNFLLWQASYTEFYVTPKLWPDFSKSDLIDAIVEYQHRERRFGKSPLPTLKGRGT